ncbi:MAG: hypothetical protein K2X93_03165 [Candidatus Obscuribacterales bacterium]|nr:hypothetical protein [Candidatus Obscuribacterales bacterium]
MSSSIIHRADRIMDPLKSRRGATLVISICITMVMLIRAYYWLNHPLLSFPDQSAYLYMADLLLQGQIPYLDFFEWNPPLIMYLSIIPVLISKVVPIHPVLSLNLSIICLTFIASISAVKLADRYLDNDSQFVISIAVILGATYFNFAQEFDAAEREHIFMVAYTPFMLVRYINWTTEKKVTKVASILTGLLAGVAIALKPQFAFAFLSQEIVFYLQNRDWKRLFFPEMLAVAFVHVTYIGALCFLPKAAWDVIITQVVPLYLHGFDYSKKCLIYMLHSGFYFADPVNKFCLALGLAIMLNRYSNWIAPLTAFMFASFVNYVHGEQAWIYRMIPMASGAYMIIFLVVALLFIVLKEHTKRPILVNGIALTTLFISTCSYCWIDYNWYTALLAPGDSQFAPLGGYIGRNSGYRDMFNNPSMVILQYTKPGDKVLYVGTGIADGYPAIVQSNRSCATRYLFSVLILIEHCIKNRPDKEFWSNLMETQLKNYENDIKRDKPQLIMVFDLPAFVEMLTKYNFFNRCIGSDYVRMKSKNSCLVFVRKNK